MHKSHSTLPVSFNVAASLFAEMRRAAGVTAQGAEARQPVQSQTEQWPSIPTNSALIRPHRVDSQIGKRSIAFTGSWIDRSQPREPEIMFGEEQGV